MATPLQSECLVVADETSEASDPATTTGESILSNNTNGVAAADEAAEETTAGAAGGGSFASMSSDELCFVFASFELDADPLGGLRLSRTCRMLKEALPDFSKMFPQILDTVISEKDPRVARPIVDEAMERCCRNFQKIALRLEEMEYPIKRAFQGIPLMTPLPQERLDAMAHCETSETVPRTPLLLDAFWRKCGGVMLLDYDHYAHKDWYRTHYPALWNRGATHADPVSIITPATLGNDIQSHLRDGDGSNFAYCIAPDDLHKDNYSGGPASRIIFGDAINPIYISHSSDECSGAVSGIAGIFGVDDHETFLAYLRRVMISVGFPGLMYTAKDGVDLSDGKSVVEHLQVALQKPDIRGKLMRGRFGEVIGHIVRNELCEPNPDFTPMRERILEGVQLEAF